MNEQTKIAVGLRPEEARFNIGQLYALHEQDLLNEWKRIELIKGEIRTMSPQHMPHMRAKRDAFIALLPSVREAGYELGLEASVELGEFDLPMPDIFVYEEMDAPRGLPGKFLKLVIEVAESTARNDLGEKLELYASFGVPEYWVVIPRKLRIERFAEPRKGTYLRHDSFGYGDSVFSVTLPSIVLPGGSLIG